MNRRQKQKVKVIETCCFPNKWKVDGCKWGMGNYTSLYFKTEAAAKSEAARINKERGYE